MYNILTSNFHAKDPRLIRTLLILNTFLIIGVVIFLFFFIFNYFILFKSSIASLNLMASSLSLLLFLDLRFNKNINRVKYISLLMLFNFFIFFFYMNQAEDFSLVWNYIFPIAAIVLLGVQRGSILSAIYLSIVFTLAFNGIGVWDNGAWSPLAFLRLILSSIVLISLIITVEIALENSYKSLEHLSNIDPLTELYNRRKINEVLEKELDKSHRHNTVLSLILFDIDDFKKINDTFGHNAGDAVLKQLSKTIRDKLRKSDSLARWGGEEFLIVLPMLNLNEAKLVAEKLKATIKSMECNIDSLTCSFGVAQYDDTKDSIESFISRADTAMYRAKESGKNCVFS